MLFSILGLRRKTSPPQQPRCPLSIYHGCTVPSHGVDPAIVQQLQRGSHFIRGHQEELKEDYDEPEEQSLKEEGLEQVALNKGRDQDNEQEGGRKNS